MSQAKRATDLFHGSGVKVAGSGMADLAGCEPGEARALAEEVV
jgi:hypothetical protein